MIRECVTLMSEVKQVHTLRLLTHYINLLHYNIADQYLTSLNMNAVLFFFFFLKSLIRLGRAVGRRREWSVSRGAGWTGVEILRDIKEKDEDGRMRRDSLRPQEAYPLLLLLLFYNELLKPSFPSLP